MPSDEYAPAARGPLRLKGAAGVTKKKKKKGGKSSTDLEKNLSTGGTQQQPGDVGEENKTETERRFAEAKRKRLKELTESGRIRPELLKTHKQRVEELNAHLARLSEHHDMPKIGPG
ncbi:hypothetical protein B0I37DRAFT_357754 [Chaetomium sp. MPI-CAGE-AT-0009]|nr:hypothetical protein B0I37DRAFT_357754 [Chaetomium sp. MPI-CAGE-AT-0009]